MSRVDPWLAPLHNYLAPERLLAELRRHSELPGDTDDPEALFRHFLVSVEWHYLSAREWSKYFLRGQKADDLSTSPEAAIAAGIDAIRASGSIPPSVAAMLAEAYLKSRKVAPAELFAGIAHILGDRSPAVLGLLIGRALREEQLGAAADLVDAAKQRYPGQPETLFGEARYCLSRGLPAEATALLVRLVDQFPGYRPAWEVLIETLLLEQRWEEATKYALQAVEKMPAELNFLRQAARAYEASGKPESSLQFLDKALDSSRLRTDHSREDLARLTLEVAARERALGRPRNALRRCSALLEQGHDAPQLIIEVATCLRQIGDMDQAADLLERAVRKNPGSPDLKVRMGEILFDMHRDQEAFDLLQSVAEEHPGRTDCLLLMAYLCLRNRMFPEAVELATAVAQADAARAVEALMVVGDASRFQGRAAAAASAYEAALELAPDNAEIRRRIQELEKTDPPPKASSRRADT